jgi:hypothetical protein
MRFNHITEYPSQGELFVFFSFRATWGVYPTFHNEKIHFILIIYSSGEQIKENEVAWHVVDTGQKRNTCQALDGNLTGRHNLGDMGINRNIILKCISNRIPGCGLRLCGLGTNSGFLWIEWWPFEFHKDWELLNQLSDYCVLKNSAVCIWYLAVTDSFAAFQLAYRLPNQNSMWYKT